MVHVALKIIISAREVGKLFEVKHKKFIEIIRILYKCDVLTDIDARRCTKTGFRGFRPGPTKTRLYSHRRLLEV